MIAPNVFEPLLRTALLPALSKMPLLMSPKRLPLMIFPPAHTLPPAEVPMPVELFEIARRHVDAKIAALAVNGEAAQHYVNADGGDGHAI